jgi:ribosomal-protein-alanine N-acetyltransferase
VLREVLENDAPFIVDISFYNGKAAKTEREVKAMLKRINADVARGESIHWGVTLKTGGGVIGTCGFYRGFDRYRGEIAYVLKEAYRG